MVFVALFLRVLVSASWSSAAVAAVECDMFPDLRSWFRDDSSYFLDPQLEAKAETAGRQNQMFGDFDGDGNMDFFHNNHNTEASPGVMRGKFIWGTVSEQTLPDGTTTPIVLPVNMTYNVTDPPVPIMQGVLDAHGTAILDIDGDGYKDLYISIGGGKGKGIGLNYSNFLFWGGGPTQDGEVWDFEGGAFTAMEAGLENDGGNGRGRFNHFADFNGDGLLDVLVANDIRKDDLHSPSRIYYNNGNRTFSMDPSFSEYIQVAIFDRFGGNGLWGRNGEPFKDLIIQREDCTNNFQTSDNWTDYCATREKHSFAVYRYDEEAKMMMQTYSTYTEHRNWLKAFQAEDIDGDNKMDLIFYTNNLGLEIFYSKSRGKKPMFTDGTDGPEPDEVIEFPDGSKGGFMAIVDDFNLDGNMDVLAFALNNTNKDLLVTMMYTRTPFATEPPYFELVQQVGGWPQKAQGTTQVKDIGAIDYNNDGYRDIAFQSKYMHFLTNTFLTAGQGQSQCDKPQFLAVVLQGKHVNEYGIGASVKLLAREVGPYHNETRWFSKTVNSYSHGTSMNGGNQDPRMVFGFGKMGRPVVLQVLWPDGHKTKVKKSNLMKKMNDITDPFIAEY